MELVDSDATELTCNSTTQRWLLCKHHVATFMQNTHNTTSPPQNAKLLYSTVQSYTDRFVEQ